MIPAEKLIGIKILHTTVWVFFNVVLGYLFYAVLVNRIDHWVWIGLSLILVECVVLVVFRMMCPLTVLARRYSASNKANFDIYLPNWLAQQNKRIYGTLLAIIVLLLIWRLLTKT